MTAYFIAHRREITDPDRLKQYGDGIDATIRRFGGEVVVRADAYEVLEGAWHSGRDDDDSRPERLTVIAFPDMKSLKGWYESAEYAPLKALRQDSAVHDVAAVQGV